MANFPTLSQDISIKYSEQINKPTLKVKYGGGYTQSRPKVTRSLKNFSISYNGLTASDMTTLNTFFDTYAGDSFDWVNPISSETHTVRFSEDLLKYEHLGNNLFTLSLGLEEI